MAGRMWTAYPSAHVPVSTSASYCSRASLRCESRTPVACDQMEPVFRVLRDIRGLFHSFSNPRNSDRTRTILAVSSPIGESRRESLSRFLIVGLSAGTTKVTQLPVHAPLRGAFRVFYPPLPCCILFLGQCRDNDRARLPFHGASFSCASHQSTTFRSGARELILDDACNKQNARLIRVTSALSHSLDHARGA